LATAAPAGGVDRRRVVVVAAGGHDGDRAQHRQPNQRFRKNSETRAAFHRSSEPARRRDVNGHPGPRRGDNRLEPDILARPK
jgi:hypothetical protein